MRKLKIFKGNKDARTVYISGQITGLEQEVAQAKFEEAEILLVEKGYKPFNPMKLNPPTISKRWKEYMLDDIILLFNCDAIYLLDNWQESKGARIEHFIAKEMNMVILSGETI